MTWKVCRQQICGLALCKLIQQETRLVSEGDSINVKITLIFKPPPPLSREIDLKLQVLQVLWLRTVLKANVTPNSCQIVTAWAGKALLLKCSLVCSKPQSGGFDKGSSANLLGCGHCCILNHGEDLMGKGTNVTSAQKWRNYQKAKTNPHLLAITNLFSFACLNVRNLICSHRWDASSDAFSEWNVFLLHCLQKQLGELDQTLD